jgi:DNA-binding response OmpR family regulator
MRILVIEDEAKTAEFLKKGLGPADHRGLRPGVA